MRATFALLICIGCSSTSTPMPEATAVDAAADVGSADTGASSDSGPTPVCGSFVGDGEPLLEIAEGVSTAALVGEELIYAGHYSDGTQGITIMYRMPLVPRAEPKEIWEGPGYAMALIAHGADLHWIQDPGVGDLSSHAPVADWSLMHLSLAGGPAEKRIDGNTTGAVAVDGGIVVSRESPMRFELWPWDATAPSATCTASSTIRFTANDDRVLFVRDAGLDSCAWKDASHLLLSSVRPYEMHADSTHVYLREGFETGPIQRMPLPTGSSETVISEDATAFQLRGDEIFWKTHGKLMRSPKSGGAGTAVADVFDASFYVGDHYVYWFASSDHMECLRRKAL